MILTTTCTAYTKGRYLSQESRWISSFSAEGLLPFRKHSPSKRARLSCATLVEKSSSPTRTRCPIPRIKGSTSSSGYYMPYKLHHWRSPGNGALLFSIHLVPPIHCRFFSLTHNSFNNIFHLRHPRLKRLHVCRREIL